MTTGFIGAGNMARAMLGKWLASGKLSPADVWISEPNASRCEQLSLEYGVHAAANNPDLALRCDAIVLAVKPNVVGSVLAEIGNAVSGKIILSVVTGLTTKTMHVKLPGASVMRIMPNTPAMVGEGVLVVSSAHSLDAASASWALDLLASLGRVHTLPEKDFDSVVGVSGSGPAYAFIMIEAMADAGVRAGLPRQTAYELAAQTLVGAGRMVLESSQPPASLKDAVCSPGGTTIEAVYALEKGGFRAAVMDAVSVCARKAAELRKAQEQA